MQQFNVQFCNKLIHRGKILEKVLRNWSSSNGAPMTHIAKKAGYDRSTVYRHFKEEKLDFGIIQQYGRVIRHDFTKEFPELSDIITFLGEPTEPYSSMSKEECFKQVDFWKSKYIALLEQYNNVVVDKLLQGGK